MDRHLILGVLVTAFSLLQAKIGSAQSVEEPCTKGFVLLPFVTPPSNSNITPKCYRFFSEKLSFENAVARCERFKATLATPKHLADAESIANYVLENRPKTKRYWIGLSDQEEEGVFKWQDDGTQLSENFTRWMVTEPDSGEDVKIGSEGDVQDCVKMAIWIFGRKSSARFHDSHCNKRESFVCEKEPKIFVKPTYDDKRNTSGSFNDTSEDVKAVEVDFVTPKSQVQLPKNMSAEPGSNGSHAKESPSDNVPLEVVAEYDILEEMFEPGGPITNLSVKIRPEVSDSPADTRTLKEPPLENQSRNRSNIRRQKERRTCSLKCHSNYLRAICPLKFFPRLKNTKVVLNNASCRPRRNRTHLIVHTKLDHCGTVVENIQRNNKVSFRNTIHIVTSGSGIVRNSEFASSLTELMILDCRYPQEHSISQRFNPADGRPPVYRTQGEGKELDRATSLFKTAKYECPYAREEYPVKIPLSQRIFLEISIDMSSERIELHPVTCFATPDSNPFNSNNYVMMQDGCVEDETFRIEESESSKVSRFSVDAFRFVGYFRQVYIHCNLIICAINSESSEECPYACSPEAKYRRKRADEDDSEKRQVREITSHTGMIEIVDNHDDGKPEGKHDSGRGDPGETTGTRKTKFEKEEKQVEEAPSPQESRKDGGGNAGKRVEGRRIAELLLCFFATLLLLD